MANGASHQEFLDHNEGFGFSFIAVLSRRVPQSNLCLAISSLFAGLRIDCSKERVETENLAKRIP